MRKLVCRYMPCLPLPPLLLLGGNTRTIACAAGSSVSSPALSLKGRLRQDLRDLNLPIIQKQRLRGSSIRQNACSLQGRLYDLPHPSLLTAVKSRHAGLPIARG